MFVWVTESETYFNISHIVQQSQGIDPMLEPTLSLQQTRPASSQSYSGHPPAPSQSYSGFPGYSGGGGNRSQSSHSSGAVGGSDSNKSQGKGKSGKDKGCGKNTFDKERNKKSSQLVTKVWREAHTPEGYQYFWNVESNGKYTCSNLDISKCIEKQTVRQFCNFTESVWEAPAEGYMSVAEQEEEAKEQAIQEEMMQLLEQEEEEKKKEKAVEQQANLAREQLKSFRAPKTEEEAESEIVYHRDYSVPEKVDPYGSWKTVSVK